MSINVIAVLGCARSGSTMLEGKLQQAADITALGEVTHIWSKGFLGDELCGCGRNFSRCDFWTAVLDEAFGAVRPLDAQQFDRAFAAARGGVVDWDTLRGRTPGVDPLFAQVSRALYGAAHKVGGARDLLDSSKYARFAASLEASRVGQIMPVHIFRSARPNVYSLRTSKQRPQSQDGAAATMKSATTIFHATTRWSLRNLQASRFMRAHDGPKATVFYDAFCRSPDEQLQALMTRLGLSPRPSAGAGVWHSVSGNPMRFGSDRLQIKEDERWRRGLSRLDQGIITFATRWQQKALEDRARQGG